MTCKKYEEDSWGPCLCDLCKAEEINESRRRENEENNLRKKQRWPWTDPYQGWGND
jgi:hypothetical protein